MIEKVVVLRIVRAFFGKKEPVEVMIGMFDSRGTLVGSQLLSAVLFDEGIKEGDAVNFKTKVYPVIQFNDPAD